MLTSLDASGDQSPTSRIERRLNDARVGVVRAAVLNGDFDRAYVESHRLVPNDSDDASDAEALAVVADASWGYGRFEEAERASRAVLDTAENIPLAHMVLARALLARGDATAALPHADAAATLIDGDARTCDVLGLVQKALGRFHDGAQALEACIARHRHALRSPSAVAPRTLAEMQLMSRTRPSIIAGASATTMPFRESAGNIYVQATVNGGIPSDFLIDTGADAVVITQALAAQRLAENVAHYAKAGEAGEAGIIESLAIGEMTVQNIVCNIRSTAPRLTPLGGQAISPLALGLSLRIDYRNRRLTIARELPDEPSDVELPLWMTRVPTVRAMVAGAEMRFIVDTASPVTTMSRATAASMPEIARVREVPVRMFDTWGHLDRQAALFLPGPSFELGQLRFDSYPMVVHDTTASERELGFRVGGLIGTNFLKAYRVDFDLVHARLRLKT